MRLLPVFCGETDFSGVKRNFWLRAKCECTELYATYQIRWENWWL